MNTKPFPCCTLRITKCNNPIAMPPGDQRLQHILAFRLRYLLPVLPKLPSEGGFKSYSPTFLSTFPPECYRALNMRNPFASAARLSLLLLLTAVSRLPAPDTSVADGAEATGVKVDATPSEDVFTAMRKMRVAPGLKLDLFAAEPLIQNVVSFSFDNQGRVYVVETHRRRTSVFDIRRHKDWLDADLSFRTLEDRINFYKQTLAPTDDPEETARRSKYLEDYNKDGKIDWRDMEVESERIRLLTDSTGSGRADKATTFADGFNSLVSGVAAGVANRNGQVWFTCIPNVWLLQDTKGDGTANVRVNLFHGFGVHIAYGGHDMHGIRLGPDGRIYWSIADRGTHVVTHEGKTIALPDTGAVFRANPDGSEMEVVATGLRNPQELAFDEYGNLFTGDNNADGGDKARFTHIVEGADYGWRIGWQWLPRLGAWNSEMLWGLAPTNTAAYILPAVAHATHGPAGLAYYPGTGMPSWYNHHFFIADFPGGVRHFAIKPKGASFTADNPDEYLQNNSTTNMQGKLLWGLYPVDVDFGPDGGAYVADWVQGWEKTGKGRIFRVHAPEVDELPETLNTKKILAEGMSQRTLPELAELLGHKDQRVRQEAQFALVEASRRKVWKRGPLEIRLSKDQALNTLVEVARTGTNQLARIHAIWGLGQLSRISPPSGLLDVGTLLHDRDPEIRAQAAQIMGERKYAAAFKDLLVLLKDKNPRVKFFAAMALGKLGNKGASQPIIHMLRTDDGHDPYLRHAGVMALLWINDWNAIKSAAKDPSPAVRMAALLVMRRMESPEIAQFLSDETPLALEAARAINDVPINPAMPRLATLINAPEIATDANVGIGIVGNDTIIRRPPSNTFISRRVINANFRLGQPENAQALADLAARNDLPENMRLDALDALGDWAKNSGRDRIVGLWRPLPARDAKLAITALKPVLNELLHSPSIPVRTAAAAAIEKLEMKEAGPALFEILSDTKTDVDVRIAALRALAALSDPRLAEALKLSQSDSNSSLRRQASRLAGSSGSASDAATTLASTLENASIGEKQAALQALGSLPGNEADKLISKSLDHLLSGKLPKELQLDLLEAAAKRTSPEIKDKLAKFDAARDPKDELSNWRETLHGGDSKTGRQIFFERQEIGCFRCHKIHGEGGEVGPELADLAAKKGREYILESIVYPNKVIAPGFENLLITMKNGASFVGTVKSETPDELVIMSPEDGLIKIKKADIKARDKGLSAMPEGLVQLMSKRDLRDVIEFISAPK